MRVISLIARLLLGLIFLFFGSNGFFHFLPVPPMTGLEAQFLGALFASHFVLVISGVQVIGALLLLLNRFVPLGLVLLGPIIVNIVCFHILIEPAGLPLATVVVVLWLIVAARNKQHLAGIFVQRTE